MHLSFVASSFKKFGAEARKALALRVGRGITAAVVAEAKALLTKLTQVSSPEVPLALEEQEEELEKAEAAKWARHLEWSQIARVAIKQRSLLRKLGFLNTRRGAAKEEDGAGTTPPTTTPAGAAASAAAAVQPTLPAN